MKVAIGSDHAGFELKEAIRKHLLEKGYEVLDEGTKSLDSVDYPVYGEKVGRAIIKGEAELGVVVCGSGEGICIAANKVKGIRCGIGYNFETSGLLRQHNNANVISFAGRFMTPEEVFPRVDKFLTTPYEGGRHERRVSEIRDLEK